MDHEISSFNPEPTPPLPSQFIANPHSIHISESISPYRPTTGSQSDNSLAPLTHTLRLPNGDRVPLDFAAVWPDVWSLRTNHSTIHIDSERGLHVANNDFKRYLEEGQWKVVSCAKVERLRSGPREVEHIQLIKNFTQSLKTGVSLSIFSLSTNESDCWSS